MDSSKPLNLEDYTLLETKPKQSLDIKEALQITMPSVEHTVAPYEPMTKSPVNEQRSQFMEMNALEVVDEQWHIRADTMDDFQIPTTELATTKYSLHDQLMISDVELVENERSLANKDIDKKYASQKVVTSEHVSTTEQQLEETVSKFYPEHIVATEMAHINIRPCLEYSTGVTNVIEAEGDFLAETPKSQVANITIPDQGHMIQQQQIPMETITSYDSKDTITHIAKPTTTEFCATECYEPVILQNENDYKTSEVKQFVCAQTDIKGLSVASINEPTIHEKETPEVDIKGRSPATAHTNIEKLNISLSQSLQEGNEPMVDIEHREPIQQHSTTSTQEAFAYATEETTTFESFAPNLNVFPNLQTAGTTIEDHHVDRLDEVTSPAVIGKHLTLNNKETHKNIKFTHTQTTHTPSQYTATLTQSPRIRMLAKY